MPKNDNAHSLRMVDSLKKNISSDAAEQFVAEYPLHTWSTYRKISFCLSIHSAIVPA